MDTLKAALARAIDDAGATLKATGRDLFATPELGFREMRTAAKVAAALRGLGLDVEGGLARTGVRARLRGGRPGPTVAVLGELDALPVADHPAADAQTGAAHACGHHAQLTHLLAVATALVRAEAMQELAGDVVLMAVPAEELVDLEWRQQQADAGHLEFLGGKAELVRIGAFDGVDLALLIHATASPDLRRLALLGGSSGFVAKRVRFIGRASHAARPWLGINALSAANVALHAIGVARETFRDEDRIRVHPIITRGGTTVNVVPADVRLETFVRGASAGAIADAAAKVDRAFRAGALATGAAVEIETLPGYLPLLNDPGLAAIFARSAVALVGKEEWVVQAEPTPASTDAGDLSQLMPVLHPFHGGCAGTSHGADFRVVDEETAYLTPAKALAWTVADLLAGDAAEARGVLAAFTPALTREQYLAHLRATRRTERFDGA